MSAASVCLSLAEILRCESLTRIQHIILFVPAAVEIVFPLTLLLNRRRAQDIDRDHWWLAADSASFVLLATVDFLTHMLQPARNTLRVFRAFDIAIGAGSFLVPLFYTIFLFLSMRHNVLPDLPDRLTGIIHYTLLLLIPAIVAMNELGSFIGISRISVPGQPSMLAIGFSNARDETLWTFFSSFTLALLITFQALTFLLAFYRTFRVFIDRRNDVDSVLFYRGLGWIAIGIKLGAVETVVGFAPGSFAAALARRLLRLVSRGCLVIGVIKGMDTAAEISYLRSAGMSSVPNPPGVRGMIGNPRNSTFMRMSPHATTFHDALRKPKGKKGSKLREETSPFEDNRRVTVSYNAFKTPMLNLRLSNLSIPDARDLMNSIRANGFVLDPKLAPVTLPEAHKAHGYSRSIVQADATTYSRYKSNLLRASSSVKSPKRASFTNRLSARVGDLFKGRESTERNRKGQTLQTLASMQSSNRTDSMEVMREMIPQFPRPGLAPGMSPVTEGFERTDGPSSSRPQPSHSRSSSGRRKPSPIDTNLAELAAAIDPSRAVVDQEIVDMTDRDYEPPSPRSSTSTSSFPMTMMMRTPALTREDSNIPTGSASSAVTADVREATYHPRVYTMWRDDPAGAALRALHDSQSNAATPFSSGPAGFPSSVGSTLSGFADRYDPELKRPPIARVKSVGIAPLRQTPTPTGRPRHASVTAERHEFIPSFVEVRRPSENMLLQVTRADSGVFGSQGHPSDRGSYASFYEDDDRSYNAVAV